METPNAQKAISAAFDSVNLISKLVGETPNQVKKDTVERNVKHLEIMLAKEFFAEALTPTQKTDIEASITSGNSYIQ